jgi:hypothetical protein
MLIDVAIEKVQGHILLPWVQETGFLEALEIFFSKWRSIGDGEGNCK